MEKHGLDIFSLGTNELSPSCDVAISVLYRCLWWFAFWCAAYSKYIFVTDFHKQDCLGFIWDRKSHFRLHYGVWFGLLPLKSHSNRVTSLQHKAVQAAVLHLCLSHSNHLLRSTRVHPHPSSMGSDVPVLANLQGWFVSDFFGVIPLPSNIGSEGTVSRDPRA